MITQNDKKLITRVLGSQPYRKIKRYLSDKRVKNENGKIYSRSSVGACINGTVENKRLEKHIWKAVKYYQDQDAKREAEVNELRTKIQQAIA